MALDQGLGSQAYQVAACLQDLGSHEAQVVVHQETYQVGQVGLEACRMCREVRVVGRLQMGRHRAGDEGACLLRWLGRGLASPVVACLVAAYHVVAYQAAPCTLVACPEEAFHVAAYQVGPCHVVVGVACLAACHVVAWDLPAQTLVQNLVAWGHACPCQVGRSQAGQRGAQARRKGRLAAPHAQHVRCRLSGPPTPGWAQ